MAKPFPCFVLVLICFSSAVYSAEERLISKSNQAAKEFRQKIEQIADWCHKHNLEDEALFAKSVLLTKYPDRICIPRYPLKQGVLAVEKGVPSNLPPEYVRYLTGKTEERPEIKWTDQQLVRRYIATLREEYSKDLAAYAKAACKQGRGTLATQLAAAALHTDPDNIKLRAAFGFVKYKDEWRTPWEAKKRKDGFIDHPQFGWLPEKYVKQYESGQRYYKGQWISAEKDAELHSVIKNGWVIESEFYLLATNHSLEGGVQLRQKLEHLYRAWRMLFYRYYATDEQLANYFSGNITPQIPKYRHKIVVYRNRDEFLKERNVDETTGGHYAGSEHCCFFSFQGGNTPYGTMFHEMTHQLFAEIDGNKVGYGYPYNYWIVEGVADFMSTFRMEEHFYTVGNNNMHRIPVAKRIWKDEAKTLPLADLLEFNGSRKWTTKPYENIGSLYAQSASRFQYLMFADGGQYRDAMLVYLWMVYNRKDTRDTFQQLFKMTPNEFENKFRQFLEE
jgi:hypothetical protein